MTHITGQSPELQITMAPQLSLPMGALAVPTPRHEWFLFSKFQHHEQDFPLLREDYQFFKVLFNNFIESSLCIDEIFKNTFNINGHTVIIVVRITIRVAIIGRVRLIVVTKKLFR